MENIKIFATPDAHRFIMSSYKIEETEYIFQDLLNQLTKDGKKEIDSYDSRTSLGISAVWAEDDVSPSFVLIYKKDTPALEYVFDRKKFWNALKTAIPVNMH